MKSSVSSTINPLYVYVHTTKKSKSNFRTPKPAIATVRYYHVRKCLGLNYSSFYKTSVFDMIFEESMAAVGYGVNSFIVIIIALAGRPKECNQLNVTCFGK